MIRAIAFAAMLALTGCGVDGAPVAPDGAVSAVVEGGVGLTPEKGGI